MKISILPKSRPGTWSVGLSLFSLVTSFVMYLAAERMDLIRSDMIISIIGGGALILAIAAAVIGAIAVISKKDMAILVFLSILLGIVIFGFAFIDI